MLMPSASMAVDIVLAVYMPPHAPAPKREACHALLQNSLSNLCEEGKAWCVQTSTAQTGIQQDHHDRSRRTDVCTPEFVVHSVLLGISDDICLKPIPLQSDSRWDCVRSRTRQRLRRTIECQHMLLGILTFSEQLHGQQHACRGNAGKNRAPQHVPCV